VDLPMAELAEAEARYQLVSGAPPRAAARLGIGCSRMAGGVAVMMREDPARFWCKALGLGFTEPITPSLVRHVCGLYSDHGVPAFALQLAHAVLPPGWDGICAANLLTEGNRWLKVAHPLADIDPPPGTGPQVSVVTPDEAGQWASVLARGYGMPGGGLVEMLAATVGRPGFRAYAAWERDRMTAAASMYYYQDVAHLAGAATLPGARRHGAQTALIAARLRDARAAGCRRAYAETRQETGTRNPSLHNLRRAGFDVLYERVNWLWQASAPARPGWAPGSRLRRGLAASRPRRGG
jgi:ribosomal protein S18 acetylase RimI-like enzyme